MKSNSTLKHHFSNKDNLSSVRSTEYYRNGLTCDCPSSTIINLNNHSIKNFHPEQKKNTLFFIELQYFLAFCVLYSDCIAFILHMMLQHEMLNETLESSNTFYFSLWQVVKVLQFCDIHKVLKFILEKAHENINDYVIIVKRNKKNAFWCFQRV